ncbi:MAG: gamma-glutamyltransferase [Anaerolineae bacterium]
MSSFCSSRSVVMAPNGAVATSQPLAAQAGLRILQAGGNAVDAAVATAAALNVVEPISTGIGGDVFALIWNGSGPYALNASGRAPAALTLDLLRSRGYASMPYLGPLAITVPGAVAGWCEAVERFGRMSMAEVLAPAIAYAEQGFPVTPIIARGWANQVGKLLEYSGADGGGYLLGGRAPRAGEVWRQPALARSLRAIAEGGRDAYYRGPIAQAIAETVQAAGGVLAAEDLAANRPTWEDPISVDYRGVQMLETPPNGQGLAALIALGVARGWPLSKLGFGTADTVHLLAEAMKIGWADALEYVADPTFAPAPLADLLNADYAASRARDVVPSRASQYPAGRFASASDTVYLTVVDADRNAVSFINSNYAGIGSGVVVRDWGIALQNRGANFSLDPTHANVVAPGKRPYHTIIPAMALRDGRPWLSFGVMGGFMQPQGHVQVLINMVDFGMDPQAALDAPRWSVEPSTGELTLEHGLGGVADALARLGHRVSVAAPEEGAQFGGGQVIMIDPETNMLHAGSDPRKDGCAVGY